MKHSRLAVAALLFGATMLPGQQPQRYRVETRSVSTSESPGMKQKMASVAAAAGEDLGEVGALGAATEMIASTMALVTLTKRDSAGGVIWHAVVDSFVNDQGKLGETLRRLGIGGDPVNLVGATFDTYAKDSSSSPINRTEGKVGNLLMTLTTALMPMMVSKSILSKGQIVTDSSFTQQNLPVQGALVQVRTNGRTERKGVDESTEIETNWVATQTDLGATKGINMATTVAINTRVIGPDKNVVKTTSSTTSSVVSLAPVAGATISTVVETKSVVRVP